MFISVLISVNAECITTEIYGTTWRLECKIFGEIQTLISVSLKAGLFVENYEVSLLYMTEQLTQYIVFVSEI